MKVPTFWEDSEYQDRLLKLLSQDKTALKQCASLLKADDFQPQKGARHGRPRWVVAERVLDYYRRFQQPVGKLLRADVLEYSARTGLGDRQIAEIEEYLQYLARVPTNAPDDICDKIVRFKEDKLRAKSIEELVEAQSAGTLTTELWQSISTKALNGHNGNHHSTDYFETLESRIEYRNTLRTHSTSKIPCFLIDPLDALIRGIGPGSLGLVMAPTGRGKSLALIWFALMFALQKLNVILITLEDPREEVESRLDAAVSGLQISHLSDMPNTLRTRFKNFRGRHSILHGRIKIVDGTEEGMSVAQIEAAIHAERDTGFRADVVLVDYDEEIIPAAKQKERRFELSDVYRDLRRLMARQNMIGWVAAQTQRGTEKLKILSKDHIAEDIGKIRKTSLVLSLGQGDWGPQSIFLWVAKHKFDKSHIGCHIVPDKERMLLFDRELTRQAQLRYEQQTEEGEEEL